MFPITRQIGSLSGEATLPFEFLGGQPVKERICSFKSKFFP